MPLHKRVKFTFTITSFLSFIWWIEFWFTKWSKQKLFELSKCRYSQFLLNCAVLIRAEHKMKSSSSNPSYRFHQTGQLSFRSNRYGYRIMRRRFFVLFCRTKRLMWFMRYPTGVHVTVTVPIAAQADQFISDLREAVHMVISFHTLLLE